MDREEKWDISEIIIGQIAALKLLQYNDRDTADKITKLECAINKSSVGWWWNRY
jgi:hypothetical protein